MSKTRSYVLRDPSLYQLPHQCGGQGTVHLETDGALAGVVGLEFVLAVEEKQ